jgi:hypothetical protein
MIGTRSTDDQMTLGAIREDKWASVQLPLPQDAGAELLAAARSAAQECADDARRIVWANARSEDPEDQGYAAEMQFAEGEALDRIDLIDRQLQGAGPSFPEP